MRCHSTFKGGSRFLVGKASWESEPGTVAFLSPGLGSETHLGRTEGVSPAQEMEDGGEFQASPLSVLPLLSADGGCCGLHSAFSLVFTVASLLIALWQLVLWASVSNPRLGLVSL